MGALLSTTPRPCPRPLPLGLTTGTASAPRRAAVGLGQSMRQTACQALPARTGAPTPHSAQKSPERGGTGVGGGRGMGGGEDGATLGPLFPGAGSP